MERPITTTHGGLRGLLGVLDAVHAAGEPGLLGIVVATEGSTYQKPGALVLLDRHGLRHGVISGGCLEPELEQRAQAVFASGRAGVVDFDTRSDEDLVFGSGTGCRGRVHLLLLPQPPGAPLTQALHHCVRSGDDLAIEVSLDGAAVGSGVARSCAAGPPHRWQWLPTGTPVDAATAAARVRLRIAAPPRVLLLGAGPETVPLLEFMHRFGWPATVVEHRGRWSAFARSGGAQTFIERAPADAIGELAGTRCDAAIVMSHNYTLDAQYLRFCAGADIGYVGLLGPPARRDALLAELGADAERLRPRLHAPVGLDLGGSGPAAIALATVAELQQHFARRPRV